ncbi:uncharacterized protein LOC114349667 [Ostrinia furnacalis]|uniref:uncharacterized protein LOC114349667 n=1 Tax=Ostrinia furnacalis TaxID=93504 RepID=UPI00103EB613|nr:uncharacterized protein LOC114349667 [Ostrinia furnacalis]
MSGNMAQQAACDVAAPHARLTRHVTSRLKMAATPVASPRSRLPTGSALVTRVIIRLHQLRRASSAHVWLSRDKRLCGALGASASRLTARARRAVVAVRALTSPLDNGRCRPGTPLAAARRDLAQSLSDPQTKRVPCNFRVSGAP